MAWKLQIEIIQNNKLFDKLYLVWNKQSKRLFYFTCKTRINLLLFDICDPSPVALELFWTNLKLFWTILNHFEPFCPPSYVGWTNRQVKSKARAIKCCKEKILLPLLMSVVTFHFTFFNFYCFSLKQKVAFNTRQKLPIWFYFNGWDLMIIILL